MQLGHQQSEKVAEVEEGVVETMKSKASFLLKFAGCVSVQSRVEVIFVFFFCGVGYTGLVLSYSVLRPTQLVRHQVSSSLRSMSFCHLHNPTETLGLFFYSNRLFLPG